MLKNKIDQTTQNTTEHTLRDDRYSFSKCFHINTIKTGMFQIPLPPLLYSGELLVTPSPVKKTRVTEFTTLSSQYQNLV